MVDSEHSLACAVEMWTCGLLLSNETGPNTDRFIFLSVLFKRLNYVSQTITPEVIFQEIAEMFRLADWRNIKIESFRSQTARFDNGKNGLKFANLVAFNRLPKFILYYVILNINI